MSAGRTEDVDHVITTARIFRGRLSVSATVATSWVKVVSYVRYVKSYVVVDICCKYFILAVIVISDITTITAIKIVSLSLTLFLLSPLLPLFLWSLYHRSKSADISRNSGYHRKWQYRKWEKVKGIVIWVESFHLPSPNTVRPNKNDRSNSCRRPRQAGWLKLCNVTSRYRQLLLTRIVTSYSPRFKSMFTSTTVKRMFILKRPLWLINLSTRTGTIIVVQMKMKIN